MVVGAGIAGVQAALDLANAGFHVHLVEKKAAIGGVVAQLDRSYPTNESAMCVVCMMSPNLMECGRNQTVGGPGDKLGVCGRHHNIEIHTLAEVKSVSGAPGNFKVTVAKGPRFVDEVKCTACGICTEVCPLSIPDKFNQGLKDTKAISLLYGRAIPATYAIQTVEGKPEVRVCPPDCKLCVEACPAEAIDLKMKLEKLTLNVGAIIAAPGFQVFDPTKYEVYHYAANPNVVTSLDFERILSEAGPYGGRILRPSDQKEPQKIAWLQCVGSRDQLHCNNSYCSEVCCMYAIKQTMVTKGHNNAVDTAIFFMDMRTHGKDYEQYYNRAKKDYGVRFIRSRVHSIDTDPLNPEFLSIRYLTEEGELKNESFDMVVLSVGLETSPDALALAKTLGIKLNPATRFADTSIFAPVSTNKPGVFACGVFQGPKDIPQSTMEASAAAAAVGELLAPARGSAMKFKKLPAESDVTGQAPRVGVFVCDCGQSMGKAINIPSLAEYVATIPGVAFVDQNPFACSVDYQDKIQKAIKKNKLNRVVVAACSPRIYTPMFMETIQQAGLNPYLLEMANIRDQAAWVHAQEPDKALDKAKALVRGAVARVAHLEPLHKQTYPVHKTALVVGGGVAGMEAAHSIAEMGFKAVLVEKGDTLGGQARNLVVNSRGLNYQGYVDGLIKKVKKHRNIEILFNTTVKETGGFAGNFSSVLTTAKGDRQVDHGVTIMATGGQPYKPEEYLYGQHNRVMTLFEIDKLIAGKDAKVTGAKQVVFIQCVGSREPQRPYCSRVCCTHSVESAIELKRLKPEMDVIILYREMRTYGDKELLYKEAREQGVMFIRYDLDSKPQVKKGSGGKLQVTVNDPILGRPVLLKPDFLALASAVLPNPTEETGKIFKLPRDAAGFFSEAHAKRRPLDSPVDGIFLAGLAHSPKPMDESIAEAKAAASRAAYFLAQDTVEVGGIVAVVDQDKCAVCLTCVRTCPFNVPAIDYKVDAAFIDPVKCQGCGVCVSECPAKAITMETFTDSQIIAQETALAAG